VSGYRFKDWYIPERMMPLIVAYVVHRHHPDDPFLDAVICNDLVEACLHADAENLANLPAYAAFFYNEAPAPCWGSREKVEAWLGRGKQAAIAEEVG
jgi:hypothetical protein